MNKSEFIETRESYGYRFMITSPGNRSEPRQRTSGQIEAEARRKAIDASIERKRLNSEIGNVIDEC